MDNAPSPFTIIIPAYNEEAGIAAVIENLLSFLEKKSLDCEVLIIDDGSRDKTFEQAVSTGVKVLRHKKNRGYGAALKTGITFAANDIIVIIDADGTYPIESIPDILKQLDESDMVVGARTGKKVKIPLVRRPAKWVLRKLAEYITGEKIPDLNSGLRAFRRSCVIQYFPILSNKFSFTTTITVAMLCDSYSVIYQPINYMKRKGKSKIVPMDFINFMSLVLRLSMLFNPLKIFIPIAMFSILAGFMKFAIDLTVLILNKGNFIFSYLFTDQVISASCLILWFTGLQVLLIGMVADGIIRKIGQRNLNDYKSKAIKVIDSKGHAHKEAHTL
ncbi:MAG: glycosyltransferase family 2 protein [Spirochaetales bacterium]|nr:glycosyltransferase family 2 protein [Spirochaetales bacterium]